MRRGGLSTASAACCRSGERAPSVCHQHRGFLQRRSALGQGGFPHSGAWQVAAGRFVGMTGDCRRGSENWSLALISVAPGLLEPRCPRTAMGREFTHVVLIKANHVIGEATMFRVIKLITPRHGAPIPDVDISIVDDDSGITLRETSVGKALSVIFSYDDGLYNFSFGAQVLFKDNKHWMVWLGRSIEKAFRASISVDDVLPVARNIRGALSVYDCRTDGPVTDVRFEMSEWSNWDRSRSPILRGDHL